MLLCLDPRSYALPATMASGYGIYHVSQWGPAVGGASGSRRVTLEGYAKLNSAGVPYCVANELIASRIGHALGLPLPPGSPVYGPANEVGWVTLTFGDGLPPIDPADVVSTLPEVSAGVIVFDSLIINSDRHTGNLRYRPSLKRLEVFDHSHALLGTKASGVADRLSQATDILGIEGRGSRLGGNRHCLMDHVTSATDLVGWAERVETSLREDAIVEYCNEAQAMNLGITSDEADRVARFLIMRKRNLADLIRKHAKEFKGISSSDWGLV